MRTSANNDVTTVLIKGTVITESEKAYKFDVQAVAGEPIDVATVMWFPKSQCSGERFNVKNIGEDEMHIPRWLAEKSSLVSSK